VIESAVADIVAPAIAADDPNALVEEIAVVFFEFLDRRVLRGFDRFDEFRNDLPLPSRFLMFARYLSMRVLSSGSTSSAASRR
jgi:hypothetical protein